MVHLEQNPIENLIISPIGLVQKSDPGEFSLIFDLSYPQGTSINAAILREDATVSLAKFDKVVSIVRH